MTTPQIVAADHPSLERDIERFLAEVRSERRYFGPSAARNPKPFPSELAALDGRGGFRLAAIECGRIVGVTRVDGAGELSMVVVADRRGQGIGTALGRAALERAIGLHYRRLVMHSRRGNRAARAVGQALGCVVVDTGRDRTEVIIDVPTARSA